METININQFLEIVENLEGAIEVHEYDGERIFTVSHIRSGSGSKRLAYLEVPKSENVYEFIYQELIRKFEGKCEQTHVHHMSGELWHVLTIGKAVVVLKFFLIEGKNFLFGLYQENR